MPSAKNRTKSVSIIPAITKFRFIVPPPQRLLPHVLTLHRDLLRALARCTCTEQYRSTLLPRAL